MVRAIPSRGEGRSDLRIGSVATLPGPERHSCSRPHFRWPRPAAVAEYRMGGPNRYGG